jgi:glyoxylate reductase/D-3-phosphoglycerate dehydrogenase
MPLPRIVVVPPTFAEIAELARTLAPSGFELVIVRNEHTELEAALATAEYLVCYPNVRTGDAFGTIGKKVARLARAFGMRVQYYDIVRMTEDAEDALGVRFRLMGELLTISDIVTLHVPLNTTTHHMIGAHELASMKPEAIIVNTSRGPVIDEAALAYALADNKLFGAGLDVFDQEPPPPDNPLFALKNVVLTSHFAGPTWDNQIARLRNAYDNVQRVARGEPPLWVAPELSDLVM